MDMGSIMGLMNSPNGLKAILKQPAFEDEETGYEFSQADLIADVVNILRMDTKRIAAAHDVEVEIDQMTPDKAAGMLQDVVQDDGQDLIRIFDEVEDERMRVLAAIEGEDEVEDYLEMKQSLLYTVPDEGTATED